MVAGATATTVTATATATATATMALNMKSTATTATSGAVAEVEVTCNTCHTTFPNKDAKREHMKSQWHVYNLKRQIAYLPPISSTVFQEKVLDPATSKAGSRSPPRDWDSDAAPRRRGVHRKTRHQRISLQLTGDGVENSSDVVSSDKSEDSHSSSSEDSKEFDRQGCLFCNSEPFQTLDETMAHMEDTHGFSIPHQEQLIDVESFLSYLHILISDFHECLYCGGIKQNKSAVQHHMRHGKHCKIDLDGVAGYELRQFYDGGTTSGEEPESGEGVSEDESAGPTEILSAPRGEEQFNLPSGRILGRRLQAPHSRHRLRIRNTHSSTHHPSSTGPKRLLSSESADDSPTRDPPSPSQKDPQSEDRHPPPSTDRRITTRPGTSTSLIGIPEHQQRSLLLLTHKMAKIEASVRKEYEANVQLKANQQKRFRVKSMGKKAGGLEKRLG